jgi:rfaE bifunctional protein kinase chain/domain
MSTLTLNNSTVFEEVLRGLPEGRVAVFGDFCLDAYWWLGPGGDERSLETGLPVERVFRQLYGLGGAGNVVANLIDLGTRDVRAIGVVGSDLFGVEMMRLLNARGADTSGMIRRDDWQTMVYAKRFSGEEEKNRLDFGALNTLADDTRESLIEALDAAAALCSVVILNQQMSAGISTPEVIARVNELIKKRRTTRFIVDSRDRARLYRGAIYKLNTREAGELLGEPSDGKTVVPAARARLYAESLHERTGQPVFLTRGERGIVVADMAGVHEIPGIQILERTDPVGGGDTAVAAVAAALASGRDPLTAAQFANVAASVTVRKLHTTGTATPEEIRLVACEIEYIHSPELAEDARYAHFVKDTDIELVHTIPAGARIQHAIFDHDGTLSTLREGWEQVMQPMMVEVILGPRFAEAKRSLLEKVQEAAQEFIDKTTGVQTLAQMQGLVRMVRQFGFVPESQILDEHGYKSLYNERLLNVVLERLRKLERGQLEPEDFQIKNAGQLLRELYVRGVRLYLASGTDEADVRREADAMGYADVFEGRIFGAVGDVKIEAKRVVVERIVGEHKLAEGEFATFGDGPVEIRETYRHGGICVGVASDEVRRFGLNEAKRARLIRAGAQMIVPDFSQLESLLSVLHLN